MRANLRPNKRGGHGWTCISLEDLRKFWERNFDEDEEPNFFLCDKGQRIECELDGDCGMWNDLSSVVSLGSRSDWANDEKEDQRAFRLCRRVLIKQYTYAWTTSRKWVTTKKEREDA